MGGNTCWVTSGIYTWSDFIYHFSSDLLLSVQNVDFASYADDNTIYDAGENIVEIIFSLQESSKKLFKWFANNQMKTNEDKRRLIVSANELTEIQIRDFSIKIAPVKSC